MKRDTNYMKKGLDCLTPLRCRIKNYRNIALPGIYPYFLLC